MGRNLLTINHSDDQDGNEKELERMTPAERSRVIRQLQAAWKRVELFALLDEVTPGQVVTAGEYWQN